MLRHVVLLRLTPTGSDDATIERITRALESLPSRIPCIRAYRVDRDLGLAPDNAHLVITAEVDDPAALSEYRDHPAHREVLDGLILPVLELRTAAQFDA